MKQRFGQFVFKRLPIVYKLSAASVIIILLALLVLLYGGGLVTSPSLRLPVVLVLAAILTCLSTWFLVGRYVKRPVDEVIDGMDRLAEKEFDFRLIEDEDEEVEFSELAISFNEMASMLSSSLHELKKSQDYQRSIVESSADIIITVNPSGKIQTINAGTEKTLGYRRIELIGQPIEMIFANPDDRNRALAKLGDDDNLANYQTKFVTKDGGVRDVLLTLSQLRNDTGAVIGTIGISKDITRELRLQKELIQSQRLAAIGEVATGIQHTMKNMLNACKGGAYMVRLGLRKDNRKMLVEGWEMVDEGITRLTDMSQDMLKYVREFRAHTNRVDIRGILSEIQRVTAQSAADKGVKLQLDVPDGLPEVVCDSSMIHSTVLDLVSNSIDACLWKEYADSESPEVTMSAATAGDGRDFMIEVKDNGCGMAKDVQERIFTPFFSTKSKAGTGLGLSIVARMIDVHGGKIDVESEPDQGTRIRVTLPVDGTDGK